MKFMLFVLPTIPATFEDRQRLRPIGRNNERYQQMLDDLRRLAVFADDAGFDVMPHAGPFAFGLTDVRDLALDR